MRLLLCGYGRVGRMIEELAISAGHTIAGAIDKDNIQDLETLGNVADVIVDFSSPSMLPALASYVRRTATPLLCGTTGYSSEDEAAFNALGDIAPVMHSANYSVGVAVFKRLLGMIAATPLSDFDVEITETHHNQKVDAPSGTANMLLRALDPNGELTPVYGREGICGKRTKREVGMHALRGGTVAGEHTVAFFGTDEVLEITHKASSRRIFASGALKAAEWLCGREKGVYVFDDIIFGEDA